MRRKRPIIFEFAWFGLYFLLAAMFANQDYFLFAAVKWWLAVFVLLFHLFIYFGIACFTQIVIDALEDLLCR